jgi:2-oxoglutarate ferredoxin oxidoreductase subunit beta
MKETPEMLQWLAGRALPVERYRTLDEAGRRNHFPVGTLVDKDAADFNTRYDAIRARAQQV